ncbi:MAG: hypothetical protein ACE5GW_00760 [Planctomycetota bacterium]
MLILFGSVIFFSTLLAAPMPVGAQTFVRGDCTGDGTVDLFDATSLAAWLYTGGIPAAVPAAADANDNGDPEVSDLVYLLRYMLAGGPPPPAPVPDPGEDPTPDAFPPRPMAPTFSAWAAPPASPAPTASTSRS